MELDDLKQQWQTLERKLDVSMALNMRLLTESRTRTAKLRLLPLLLLQPVQLAIGFALAIYCAGFWIENSGAPVLFISGLALHASGVALIIDAVVRTLLIVRIDLAAPVVTIQRYVAYLRHWEIRSFRWSWMIVWALLPAMFIVAAKAVTDVDLWTAWREGILWTALGSAVGMAISYIAARLTRDRTNGMCVGYSVSAAQRALDDIEQFARE